jgi:hypothetical protein
MMSLFASPGDGYGAETLMFVLTVVILALPVALLFAASFFQRHCRQRAGSRDVALEPLPLRSLELIK